MMSFPVPAKKFRRRNLQKQPKITFINIFNRISASKYNSTTGNVLINYIK